MQNLKALLLLFACTIPLLGLAHPGHGETGGNTVTHYLAEPVHIIIVVVVLSGLIFFVSKLRRNNQHS